MASYYDILNISTNACDKAVKDAYHAMAKKHHPDRNPHDRAMAELRFRLISEAYAGLRTQEARTLYKQKMRKKRTPLKAQNDNNNTGFFTQISTLLWPGKERRK